MFLCEKCSDSRLSVCESFPPCIVQGCSRNYKMSYGWGSFSLYSVGVNARLSQPPWPSYPHPCLARKPPSHCANPGQCRGPRSLELNGISVWEQITPVIWPCRRLQHCLSWKIKALSWSDGKKWMRQPASRGVQLLRIRQTINCMCSWLWGSMGNVKEKNHRRN